LIIKEENESLKLSLEKCTGTNKDASNLAKIESELRERVKELTCHNEISEILENSDISFDGVIQMIVETIPPGMQFPEHAGASITIYNKVYNTQSFEKTKYSRIQDIKISGQKIGQIEVCYRETNSDSKTIFLPEENSLLYTVAVRVASFVDKNAKAFSLAESEIKFKTLVEKIQDVVYEVTNEGVIKYVSPVVEKILGYTPEELTGKNFFSYMYSLDRPVIMEALRNIAVLNSPYLEYRYFRKDGNLRWFRSSTSAVIENGKIVGGIGILTDIHEAKITMEALRASEDRFRTLVNSQTNYVLRTDLIGNHTYFNHKFEEEFGWIYFREGLEGSNSLLSICEYHHQRTMDTVEECIANPGRILKVELDKPTPNGSVRTTLWEFICLTDVNNNPSEIQCMGIDINDKKLTEENH
jgi:PAS domain S-box-containing protein